VTTVNGDHLKTWAAFFGAAATILAQVKEIHILWLKTQLAKTEADLRDVVEKYEAILRAEGRLSRDQDDNQLLNDEMKDLKEKLNARKKRESENASKNAEPQGPNPTG
jgi:hypothetical protein